MGRSVILDGKRSSGDISSWLATLNVNVMI